MTITMSHFAPPPGSVAIAHSLKQVEETLADWFDAPVIVMSSGRAALRVAFEVLGLERYRHRIAMSPMTATCLLDAVVRHGFPVDAASGASADAALIVDQYGFVQRWTPRQAIVVEDICHAFHGDAKSGARVWRGPLAAFSLPKFLSIDGMLGGLVVQSVELEERLRDLLCQYPEPLDDRPLLPAAAPASQIATSAYQHARLINPRAEPRAITSVPDARSMGDIARRRVANVARLLATPSARALPVVWQTMLHHAPPFAFPVFGPEPDLVRRGEMLREAGIEAGIYTVDGARDAGQPEWQRALLVPCHGWLSETELGILEMALS
jgi:hypothetical protein